MYYLVVIVRRGGSPRGVPFGPYASYVDAKDFLMFQGFKHHHPLDWFDEDGSQAVIVKFQFSDTPRSCG